MSTPAIAQSYLTSCLYLPCPCSLLAPSQPGDTPLCVLNTHLFFHYMAPHIRTMHVWAMVQVGRQAATSGLGCWPCLRLHWVSPTATLLPGPPPCTCLALSFHPAGGA